MLTRFNDIEGVGVVKKLPIPLKGSFSFFGDLLTFLSGGGFSMYLWTGKKKPLRPFLYKDLLVWLVKLDSKGFSASQY